MFITIAGHPSYLYFSSAIYTGIVGSSCVYRIKTISTAKFDKTVDFQGCRDGCANTGAVYIRDSMVLMCHWYHIKPLAIMTLFSALRT